MNPENFLHRLRTDLPVTSELSTPTPVPFGTPVGSPNGLTLRPAIPGSPDAELVATWMNREHLVDTWEQPWAPQQWNDVWEAQRHTTYSIPTLLIKDDQPVGYVEIYRPHRDEIGRCYRSAPHDLGFHIAIGDPERTGKGEFSLFMQHLAQALLEADPEAQVIILEPDYRNVRAHRAMSKHGWIDCGERQQRADRRVRLFMYPRHRGDVEKLQLPH